MPNLHSSRIALGERANALIGMPTLYATTYNEFDLAKLPSVNQAQAERADRNGYHNCDGSDVLQVTIPFTKYTDER